MKMMSENSREATRRVDGMQVFHILVSAACVVFGALTSNPFMWAGGLLVVLEKALFWDGPRLQLPFLRCTMQ